MGLKSGPLARLLRRTTRRIRLVTAAACAVRSLALLLAFILVLLLIDARWPRSGDQLGGARQFLLVVVALMIVWSFVRVRRESADPRRAARRIEAAAGIAHNRLVNAVELSTADAAMGSPALAELAARDGETLAAKLAARSYVGARPVWRALRDLGVVAVAAAGVACFWPGIFMAGVPRLLAPRADHPPYTRLKFAVTMTPTPAREGERAEIAVTLHGGEVPGQADLVWVGEKPVRVPMACVGAGEFTLKMESARETREFYIDTPKGRSRRFELAVVRGETADAKGEDGVRELVGRAVAVAKRAEDLLNGLGSGEQSAKPQAAGVDALGGEAAGVAREAADRARVPSASSAEAGMRAALGGVGDAAEELSESSESLAAALRSGDAAAIRAAIRKLGQAEDQLAKKAAAAGAAREQWTRGSGSSPGLGSGAGDANVGGLNDRSVASGGDSATMSATTGQRTEAVEPATAAGGGSAGGDLTGVPLPYRAAAAAYFRRLAEEAR